MAGHPGTHGQIDVIDRSNSARWICHEAAVPAHIGRIRTVRRRLFIELDLDPELEFQQQQLPDHGVVALDPDDFQRCKVESK